MRRSSPLLAALALCACSRRTEPPDPASTVFTSAAPLAWATVAVPECGYSVELPGKITRVVDTARGVPTTMYEASDSPTRLIAACTVFPATMELPDNEAFFRSIVDRVERGLEGLGGGVRRRDIQPSASVPPSAIYSLELANGQAVAGQLILVSHHLHELSGIVHGDASERELARVMKSYRATP